MIAGGLVKFSFAKLEQNYSFKVLALSTANVHTLFPSFSHRIDGLLTLVVFNHFQKLLWSWLA